MCVLQIDPGYHDALQSLGLTTLAAIRDHFDASVDSRLNVEVAPVRLEPPGDREPLDVFYKRYYYARPSWRFFGRPSKAQCEFQNSANLRGLGIQVADRIACGAWRDRLGRLQGAFILTRAVPQARTLVDFWRDCCRDRVTPQARDLRASLRRQLADMVQRMHRAHFFHSDLYWRNVLVTWRPPAEPELWWIDCPRGGFNRWALLQPRLAIKDLASLDRCAHQFCTVEERLRFIGEYLGPAAGPAQIKAIAQRTQCYRESRWRTHRVIGLANAHAQAFIAAALAMT